MHTYHAEKLNKLLLFLSDITGSKMEKRLDTNDVIDAVCASCGRDQGRIPRSATGDRGLTVDCLQASSVGKLCR